VKYYDVLKDEPMPIELQSSVNEMRQNEMPKGIPIVF